MTCKKQRLIPAVLLVAACLIFNKTDARVTSFPSDKNDSMLVYTLSNECINLSVCLNDSILGYERFSPVPEWFAKYGDQPPSIIDEAGFAFEITWTGWRAPGKINNADNEIRLTEKDFRLVSSKMFPEGGKTGRGEGGMSLELIFRGIDVPFETCVFYLLDPGKFYYKRKVWIRDTIQGTHFLQKIFAKDGSLSLTGGARPEIVKDGGFGQPLAIKAGQCGYFAGLEYPAAMNRCTTENRDSLKIRCSQEIGKLIGAEPEESDWVVCAYTPSACLKDWFFRYVGDIRVMPAEPYTLYNSWYDLRSPEYPGVQADNVMNEENALKIIGLFQKNMVEKYGIRLDAFVLDDGWDVYESGWQLRRESFPLGLRPLSDKLKEMKTGLGIWFGPSGGYSFRMKRIDWMKNHGYEVTGRGRNDAMLCLGGKNYGRLFEQRVTGMVREEGVSYFKWDGIQFSCSEPEHGHLPGPYSRREIISSLIGKCKAVRDINPNTYLNITSGTWLSPWWLKHANQIWMDGEDYGYSDVPSIHRRDAAITYRDIVLFEDLRIKDLWFPVSNLMTHGIIKGNLERLGGENDPIEKFTNDAMLYAARGISMFELYISPGLLNYKEWDAIGKSINWAKDRREILSNTYMTGGNPARGETYAYVHFRDKKGIIAARNPIATPAPVYIALDEAAGFSADAAKLVVEKVYPYRYVYPGMFASGDTVEIMLDGFETAIIEVSPLEDVAEPLLAGVRCRGKKIREGEFEIEWYGYSKNMMLLNPEIVDGMEVNGIKNTRPEDLPQPRLGAQGLLHYSMDIRQDKKRTTLEIMLETDTTLSEACLSLLFKPSKSSEKIKLPVLSFILDGKEIKAGLSEEKGCWAWYTLGIAAGKHRVTVHLAEGALPMQGSVECWLRGYRHEPWNRVRFRPATAFDARVMPPSPFPAGTLPFNHLLGKKEILFTR